MNKFSHIDENNKPKMVNVSGKKITKRMASAEALMFLGKDIIKLLNKDEIQTRKGPVFQTAVIAGIQAVKKTAELIPMCHPLPLDGIKIDIEIISEEAIRILCRVEMEGKTGVEMEALTGASVSALTVYDMCKAISQKMIIKEVKLLEKRGGKSDILRSQ
ncbi:cyclic pyranopterin monophosphate synthase MoaC [Lutimonas saemankumensis]|uniref:cyclic pyranopterin monophosphate synthase MoaC n=1 Tax=Lutimonas saemankumensis TaxID=483016 RepID=UPI001CD6456F|nr:cyclic pyranopterin monophosphate synthase MoaC [Lutimonas saemankumensis]MCA0932830.1 cyclic pyranopterin monophosphate synthase MoaC [Lutimonas saemankumensis]